MEDNLSRTISTLTVKIFNTSTNATLGTGILYNNGQLHDNIYVITAAHNLFDDQDAFQIQLPEVGIEFYNGTNNTYGNLIFNTASAFINCDPIKDVAVIVIPKIQVEALTGPIKKLDCLKSRGDISDFISKGFPLATFGKEIVSINPVWKHEMSDTNRFQLELKEDYDSWSIKGFSGAGIFAITSSELYLIGVFTRYRSEGQGKVIYCEYLENVNELLNKNFQPVITFSFIGNALFTKSYFENHLNIAIKNLGPRFNEEINFRLPITWRFNEVAKDKLFRQRILLAFDNWLQGRPHMPKKNQESHTLDVDKILINIMEKGHSLIENLDWNAEQKIDFDAFKKDFSKAAKEIEDKKWQLYELQRLEVEKQTEEQKKSISYQVPLQREISYIQNIESKNQQFEYDLAEINLNLANNRILIIKGDAGSGKSHLLGDIANQFKNEGKPSLLLLGQLFRQPTDIWTQLINQLGVNCRKDQLLLALNRIGEQIGARLLILIDAINEGEGKTLWKNELPGFLDEITRYPHIGLVITVRSSYFDSIFTEDIKNSRSIVKISHPGFKGNEYEALRLFCEYYNLELPTFPILSPEFSNPLFLQLICAGLSKSGNKAFPKGFQNLTSVLDNFLFAIGKNLSEKREAYNFSKQLIKDVIKSVSEHLIRNEISRAIPLTDAIKLFHETFPTTPFLLQDLIHENLFTQSTSRGVDNTQIEVIYFSYERLGDFYIADQLISKYPDRDSVIHAFKSSNELGKLADNLVWEYAGLAEAFAIILPERHSLEIYEVFNWIFTEKRSQLLSNIDEWINHYLLDSLKWRNVKSIDGKKLLRWFEGAYFRVELRQFHNNLFELAAIKSHPFNSDYLTKIFLPRTMADRDGFWQMYFRYYANHDDQNSAYPLRRLIDWAWQPNVSERVDAETARLVSQALIWALSSTDRSLRDETTKALVNLLQEQIDTLIKILSLFNDVDDPYIQERLYAVTYGCVLRTKDMGSLSKIGYFIYTTIFKHKNPPENILLRDYARNTMEYILHNGYCADCDVTSIRPPYQSTLPNHYPSIDEINKYEIENKGKDEGIRQFNFIKFDIIDWDFGEKTIERKLDDFSPAKFTTEKCLKSYLAKLEKPQRDIVKAVKEAVLLKTKIESPTINYRTNNANNLLPKINHMIDQSINLLSSNLTKDSYDYFMDTLMPYFEDLAKEMHLKRNVFDTAPIKRWIVKRAYECGYSIKLHSEFDSFTSRYDIRNPIDTIGRKYCWIALFEALAKITDNYKLRVDYNDGYKYLFYNGAWQLYLRDINASYITKDLSKMDKANELIEVKSDPWWKKVNYNYWAMSKEAWLKNVSDLPDPKLIIERTDNNNQGWLYLSFSSTWKEVKKVGASAYRSGRKEIWYLLQAYIYKRKQGKNFLRWFKGQNFCGRWMPESVSTNFGQINRESFWSPCYLERKSNMWEVIRDSGVKISVATEEAVGELSGDSSGANRRYEIPGRLIFEGMGLKYGDVDGELVDKENRVVAFHADDCGLLIKKEAFVNFLESKGFGIAWAFLGEKQIYSDHNEGLGSSITTLSGYYYLDSQAIEGAFHIAKERI